MLNYDAKFKIVKKSSLIYIGATFVLAIVMFIWGFNFLKGKDLFRKQLVFYVRYHNISGLISANPVLINGMRVGQVGSISFAPDYSGDLMVTLIINKHFPIPIDTKAKIINATLLGDKSIELVLGKSKELAQTNDTLQGTMGVTLTQQVNSALAPMKKRVEQILSSADSLISSLNDALGRNGNNSLKTSLSDLEGTFHHLNATTASLNIIVKSNQVKIGRIVSNIDSLTGTLLYSRQGIREIVQNLKNVSDTLSHSNLKAVINNTGKTIEQVQLLLTKINAGQGTVGALMSNDSLYLELNKTVIQLKKLLKNIRENPRRYFKFSVF